MINMEIYKWEYKKVRFGKELEKLGKEGWEAVTSLGPYDIFLKRPCGKLKLREVEKQPTRDNDGRDY